MSQQVLLSSPERRSSPEAQFTGLNPVPAPAPDVHRSKRTPAVRTPPLQPSISESATPVRKQAACPPPPKESVLQQVHPAVFLLLHPPHAVNFASVQSLPPTSSGEDSVVFGRPSRYDVDKMHTCDMHGCHTTMQSRAKVHTHLLEVHNRYLCKTLYCTAIFKSAAQCESHYNNVHATGEDEAFKYVTCGKTFSRRAHLRKHALKHVSEEERKFYECPEEDCTLSFSRERDLARHVKSHSESEWRCHLCEFVTKEKCTLQQHVTQQHEEPKIPCHAGCTQKFKTYDAHLRHERNQH